MLRVKGFGFRVLGLRSFGFVVFENVNPIEQIVNIGFLEPVLEDIGFGEDDASSLLTSIYLITIAAVIATAPIVHWATTNNEVDSSVVR